MQNRFGWKRILAGLMALVLLVSLSACGQPEAPASSQEPEESTGTNSEYMSVGLDGNKFLSRKLRSFSEVDVDIDVGDVKIELGKEYQVYREWGKVDYYISVKIGSDSVKIASSGRLPGPDDGSDPHVTIVVPEDAVLSSVKLHTGSGTVTVDGALIKQADCHTGSGDVIINVGGNEDDWGYELTAKKGAVSVDGTESGTSAKKKGGEYRVKADSAEGNVFFGPAAAE